MAFRFDSKDRVRSIQVAPGRILKATPVFDSYWRFAKLRQDVYMQRVANLPPPWTTDPVLSIHKFTNAYRASDRVSQYLIKNVIYDGEQTPKEIFFRTMLFKFFNRIDTWEKLVATIGTPTWKNFRFEQYAKVFDSVMNAGERLYSAAYIMPSPAFGNSKKHRNHLRLLEHMMKSNAPDRVTDSKSLKEVFELLRSYPSLGDFLAFQFTIDLNYSSMIDFSEREFVVAGPGARDGIKKCFADTAGFDETDVIYAVTEMANAEFDRQSLDFKSLWGRPLQPIDCQNLFCETDKYARVMHPEYTGNSGRSRIKQKFTQNPERLTPWFPPKWRINSKIKETIAKPSGSARRRPSESTSAV